MIKNPINPGKQELYFKNNRVRWEYMPDKKKVPDLTIDPSSPSVRVFRATRRGVIEITRRGPPATDTSARHIERELPDSE